MKSFLCRADDIQSPLGVLGSDWIPEPVYTLSPTGEPMVATVGPVHRRRLTRFKDLGLPSGLA